MVRGVEVRQMPAVRVCPPRPHEDRLHLRVRVEVEREGVTEGYDGFGFGQVVWVLLEAAELGRWVCQWGVRV